MSVLIEGSLSLVSEFKDRLKQAIWKRRIRKAVAAGLQMGDGCNISKNVFFGTRPHLIKIGNDVEISTEVAFITHAGADSWLFKNNEEYAEAKHYDYIEIKDNCFIGMRAMILHGVTIGPNSIVGAGSIVVRDVPPGTVVMGNPAQIVCSTNMYMELMKRQSFRYSSEMRKNKEEMRKSIEQNLDELHSRRAAALRVGANGVKARARER